MQDEESAYKSLLVDSNGYVKTMPCDEHSFGLEHANRPRQSFPDTYTGNGYVDILRPQSSLRRKHYMGDIV